MEQENKVSNLEDTINGVSASVKQMETQMNKIYTALVGNKELGQQGIVTRLEALESVKEKWTNKINWMYGYMFGIGTLATLFVEYLKQKFK